MRRRAFPLAFQTDEHLSTQEQERFEAVLPAVEERFGASNLMISHSSKDPHRLQQARVFTRRYDGTLVPMAKASHFIGHLTRINRFRVYAAHDVVDEVAASLRAAVGLG